MDLLTLKLCLSENYAHFVVKNAKIFSGRPQKLELVLEICRKVGFVYDFEETGGLECTVFEKIAHRDFGSKKFWFQVEKTQISLDLKIFSNN